MSERDQILISLVKEVLGPRNGLTEVLPEDRDPRSEFITGVLEPANATLNIEPEDDIDEVIEETTAEEDQDNQGFVATPGVFSPALDPKSMPHSIGLSFTVTNENGIPAIEICATWARYTHETAGWKRNPSSFISGPTNIDNQTKDWTAGNGIYLQMRTKEISMGVWRVSIFLVNVTSIQIENRPTTDDYVFQPQIRINCIGDTFLLPVRQMENISDQEPEVGSMDYEDRSLEMLYLNRTAFARGHMCGVIWKDIDPERFIPEFQNPGEAPFAWTDQESVPENDRSRFSPADVRTEMVPCYPIQSPEMAWNYSYGSLPVLNPEELSEQWDPDRIHEGLQPLVDGYRSWIMGQEELITSLPEQYQGVASGNLEKCRQIASRMEEAISLLCVNEDVRLAFCFANKAIALQSSWRGAALSWRPFQLAFILLNIPALSDKFSPDRNICDLLWFPTGGGKTEAYLGLSAFVLALRRLQAKHNDLGQDRTGAGVAVLSRYTLRLLTIQQFRRALGVITACEMLRVQNLDHPGITVGWRPTSCNRNDEFLWGGIRFSTGLWVGGGVTPNNLLSIGPIPLNPGGGGGMVLYAGALDILQGISRNYSGPNQNIIKKVRSVSRLEDDGEPAQVMSCPCCKSILAVPREGLGPGPHVMYFVYEGGNATIPDLSVLKPTGSLITLNSVHVFHHPNQNFHTLAVHLTISDRGHLTDYQVDEWWNSIISNRLGTTVTLISARPSRPGYFILTYDNSQNTAKECDFNVYCPNPECALNQHAWAEQIPLPRNITNSTNNPLGQPTLGFPSTTQTNRLPLILQERLDWQIVPPVFQIADNPSGQRISQRIPIPAYTIDDQVYHRCPSLVIATVDKFARLAYEPKAASLFGNVTHYHSRWGYYRIGCPPSSETLSTKFMEHPPVNTRVDVPQFAPPDLILQDELHLIEGPLGSMVGLYETVVDELCRRNINNQIAVPKYIASTATVRQAETQVQSLFDRRLVQFPPSAISADERFFATDQEIHPLDNRRSGRLYVAICAPGKGAQTPIVRIWSALLQSAQDINQNYANAAIDPFWTLVGYFNAMRELAGALSLYRQDIPQRLDSIAGTNSRFLDESKRLELSSRASSLNLPALLTKLDIEFPNAQDSVFATSMFGTGVDINRLSLMVVHGQPKTTASYIQATGRVGRLTSGLVVSFFRASRPRDLDHYEFFTGYHRAIYRYVEPITVAPYSPRARERALGPLSVVLLRQAYEIRGNSVNPQWRIQQRLSGAYYSEARIMRDQRHDSEVGAIPGVFEDRASHQPSGRRPDPGITNLESCSELDRWQSIAHEHHNPDEFVYNEPTLLRRPSRHVVLGDSGHHGNFREAFENAPQSLREVEETTGFED
jgi:hypothetical protein